jgi:phospholipase A1
MKRNVLWLVFVWLAPLAAHAAGIQDPSPWQQRFEQESKWRREGLSLVPYRSNYLIPWSYNNSPHDSFSHSGQYKEAKFQLSFKVLVLDNILDRDVHLYFAYTQLSLWQVYDRAQSAPFREINYEPEAMLTMDTQKDLGPIILRQTDVGIVHQSNGVSQPESRSWNRVYARFHFDRDNLAFAVRPWYRIPDSHSEDDNRHIERYMGYGDVEISYFLRHHILSMILRNNLRSSSNKGAIELDYSFPLTRILTGLVQYFNGYGETLIDYNRPVNRFSVGFALSPW